ncbi:MAG: phosphoribosylformylglycinamidine synthase [Treponema sp.]|jgi:phosphoribosylformylglycinamidine synthase|nr:phosphoribosylformylglycinamidine synthase [Treponema sp.]
MKDKTIKRVYVEKKPGFALEAERLRVELTGFLGINSLSGLRLLCRYDVARLDDEQFQRSVAMVFSEAQCDRVFYGDAAQKVPADSDEQYFAVEYLPGQYDQRADSAEQCVELAVGTRPVARSARVYVLRAETPLSEAELGAIKKYLINPVDSREADLAIPETLEPAVPLVDEVPTLNGFTSANARELTELGKTFDMAMSGDDLRFCQAHFASIKREPTLAELRLLDTYWSDHCRHTTFTTELSLEQPASPDLEAALRLYEEAREEVYKDPIDRRKTLMDMATIGAKVLKQRGLLDDVDESKEINACTVKVNAEFSDGTREPWFLLFKNETHNHPTEIEPFGGAATCLGGAIRDPLSGRAYVYQAMRITGGADPRRPLCETLPGKLPQIKIARDAAAGYSSYGNQIGLATGQVAEFYHDGFLAKRMELGAVIGAVPQAWVRREEPEPGDLVILVGGKTGRDGIGGATGSSKSHTQSSVASSGAEVQKGNAVEERKLQRLFRKPELTRLIKRCNDFGAGGVAVAVGELAAGLDINLDLVPRKYAGLDGIALAIAESQERMAVLVAAADAPAFIAYADAENLEATPIARVTAREGDCTALLRMSFQGKTIVELSRDFLNSAGAPRSATARLHSQAPAPLPTLPLEEELQSLRSASRRGLQERFDGSIGAASVLFPYGGAFQGTPECGMAALLPSLDKESRTASLMCFGYDPDLMAADPYTGAKGAIREALAKFTCLGGNPWTARLSLQEYFARPETPDTWGKPVAALLGALEAQLRLGVPAIGGKDSMSGTYSTTEADEITVPPSLAAFAAGTAPLEQVRSGALSGAAGNLVILLYQISAGEWDGFKANMNAVLALGNIGAIRAAYPVGAGGVLATLALMGFGNMTGVDANPAMLTLVDSTRHQGSVLLEIEAHCAEHGEMYDILAAAGAWALVGRTNTTGRLGNVNLSSLRRLYESPLAAVYPQAAQQDKAPPLPALPRTQKTKVLKSRSPQSAAPLVALPVFPGTNCEWDMERAFRKAGARAQLVIFRNRSPEAITQSIEELAAAIDKAQLIALSGGFSAGDEPDGSGKFIANVFRAPSIANAVMTLLEKRDGLILGICNGFQALIKLGLVPYGEYRQADDNAPTLTFNTIGRHVSRMVRTTVMSNTSPWLAFEQTNTLHVVPVSHGEGRLVIRPEQASALFKAGQVPFCYADASGQPTLAEPDNPNGSAFAIEGLCSPDGRILGKMAHSERAGDYVHINIPGNKRQSLFEAGVAYFS